MAAVSATFTSVVVAAPQKAAMNAKSDSIASRSSVAFNNLNGLRPMSFVRASRCARPVAVRSMADENPIESLKEKAQDAIDNASAAISGAKDDGPTGGGVIGGSGGDQLKSKGPERMVYEAQRNADEVGNKATEKANQAQTEWTKNQ